MLEEKYQNICENLQPHLMENRISVLWKYQEQQQAYSCRSLWQFGFFSEQIFMGFFPGLTEFSEPIV